MKLYCVIPFYNEEAYLPACIDSLLGQRDLDYTIVFVDNGSTDASADVVKKRIKGNHRAELITESQKGTGSCADSGFRYAISRGATHIARTDADCIADPNWILEVKRAFTEGTELVLGYPSYRRDMPKATIKDYFLFPLAVRLSDLYGMLYRRGSQYKTNYRIGAGNNMAITADLYMATGGFPRKPLEEQDDDVALFDAVRKISAKIKRYRSVRTFSSLRRPHKYGYLRAMLYYWNRKYQPKEVDVR